MINQLDEVTRVNYLREIYYEQEAERKYKRRILSLESFDRTGQTADDENFTFELSDELNIEESIVNELIIKEIIAHFNKEETELIKEVLIKKVSATEFGRKKGQTQQNVSKKIKKIRKKLEKFNIF